MPCVSLPPNRCLRGQFAACKLAIGAQDKFTHASVKMTTVRSNVDVGQRGNSHAAQADRCVLTIAGLAHRLPD